jgi:hypothetical protein
MCDFALWLHNYGRTKAPFAQLLYWVLGARYTELPLFILVYGYALEYTSGYFFLLILFKHWLFEELHHPKVFFYKTIVFQAHADPY